MYVCEQVWCADKYVCGWILLLWDVVVISNQLGVTFHA